MHDVIRDGAAPLDRFDALLASIEVNADGAFSDALMDIYAESGSIGVRNYVATFPLQGYSSGGREPLIFP